MLSVIVPAHNAQKTLSALLDSIFDQAHEDFELLVVDDCSTDNTVEIAERYACELIRFNSRHGPAFCRNRGAEKARGDVLVFTDSDCIVERDWLANIQRYMIREDVDAIMGRLVLMPSTFLGDSISALGFPAGGAVGFEKIWRLDGNGFTDSLSSCNCVIRKDIFWKAGGFDETFPFPGGEDSLLAYNMRGMNYRIKYCRDVLAYHRARDSFRDFLKWQFKRGVSSYIFSTKVSDKRHFFSVRVWSTGNILRQYLRDRKLPLVLFLLAVSVSVQLAGFLFARHNRELYESPHH